MKHAELDGSGVARGFATPSRKVEVWSETFLTNGYAPLPEYPEPRMGPMARPDCKFACNSDPLRGDFRVQFRPLLL